MADVQVEHGFTRVADELLEALAGARLPGRHLATVLAIIRRTYGWSRASAAIPCAELAEAVGVDDRAIRRILSDLEVWGVVCRGDLEPGKTRTVGIAKNFERWEIPRAPAPGAATGAPGVYARGTRAPAPGVGGAPAPGALYRDKEIDNKRERYGRASRAPELPLGGQGPPVPEAAGKKKAGARPFPAEGLSETELASLREWAAEKGHPWSAVEEKIEAIRDWAEGKGIRRSGWVATIRSAVRQDAGGTDAANRRGPRAVRRDDSIGGALARIADRRGLRP